MPSLRLVVRYNYSDVYIISTVYIVSTEVTENTAGAEEDANLAIKGPTSDTHFFLKFPFCVPFLTECVEKIMELRIIMPSSDFYSMSVLQYHMGPPYHIRATGISSALSRDLNPSSIRFLTRSHFLDCALQIDREKKILRFFFYHFGRLKKT